MSDDLEMLRTEGGAVALGALTPAEGEAFQRELERSPELAREFAEYLEVAALLAHSAPSVAPPPALRERIMREVAGVRPLAARVVARDEENASTGGTPDARTGSAAAPNGGELAGARVTPMRSRPLAAALPWLAAAAALLGVVWTSRALQDERDARVAAEGKSEALRAQVASLDSVVSAILAPDVQTVKLSAQGAPPSARMYWNTQSRQVVLAAFNLQPAPRGRTYQLWGIEAGKKPVSLGTFNTGTDAGVRASFRAPDGVKIAVGAVTEEPAGGSTQPTTTPFLVGEFKGGA